MNTKKGFTLIELLIVIAIIGLLSTFAMIALGRTREQSRDARRTSDIKTIQSALEMYFTKEGGYPISNPAGECLGDGNPIRVAMQKDGDVIVKVPTDPIWEDIEPALFNNNIQKDYPIGPSNSFCYWYNGKADSYYLSYYLESDSKAGTPGIHVQSINN